VHVVSGGKDSFVSSKESAYNRASTHTQIKDAEHADLSGADRKTRAELDTHLANAKSYDPTRHEQPKYEHGKKTIPKLKAP